MRCVDYVYLPPPRDFVWVNVIMLGSSATQYDMMLIVPYASSTHVITVFFSSDTGQECVHGAVLFL